MSRPEIPQPHTDDWSVDTRAGLRLHATLRTDSAVFESFFASYDAAFVLPDEKEEKSGFASCLALNHGEAHSELVERYGEFVEVCVVAHDAGTGAPVGGANFIALPNSSLITANLNYLFVDEPARRQGNFRRLVASMRELIGGLFDESDGVLVFIEQNDPLAMGEAAYRRDTEFTGLDQFDRLRIWARAGALVVDHPYVQPRLSPEQQADDTLVYSVLGAREPRLSACVLETHLRGFFGISVRKGAPLESDPEASTQLRDLARNCAASKSIALIDPRPLLARLRTRADAAALSTPSPASFRAALALS